MQGPGIKLRTPHLSTLKVKFLATKLPDKKTAGTLCAPGSNPVLHTSLALWPGF
jgi:hypothetical protein